MATDTVRLERFFVADHACREVEWLPAEQAPREKSASSDAYYSMFAV